MNPRLIGGGSLAAVVARLASVAASNCFRLSSFGRNLRGVLNTDGAAEGGLNMMWFCGGDSFDGRKEESGAMLRRCFARR